ncbi:hypothetical protein [Rhizobium mayense]|uniref:hypothetical protein n=1 Tax=Rhizobium mayense TaxID=1312184 RepID=UPI00398C81E2
MEMLRDWLRDPIISLGMGALISVILIPISFWLNSRMVRSSKARFAANIRRRLYFILATINTTRLQRAPYHITVELMKVLIWTAGAIAFALVTPKFELYPDFLYGYIASHKDLTIWGLALLLLLVEAAVVVQLRMFLRAMSVGLSPEIHLQRIKADVMRADESVVDARTRQKLLDAIQRPLTDLYEEMEKLYSLPRSPITSS